MRKRDKLGLAVAPVLLRLLLALVFIWAGVSKFRAYDPVDSNTAAALANLGLIRPDANPPPLDPNTPATQLPKPDAPDKDKPPAKDTAPPKDDGKGADGKGTDGKGTGDGKDKGKTDGGASRPQKSGSRLVVFSGDDPVSQPPAGSPVAVPPRYTARDFPGTREVPRMFLLALGIASASQPQTAADGTTTPPYFPSIFATGRWPKILAYAVAITEVGGGFMVLIGLLTRLWSFGLAVVMAGAMWLTQIGPAIASGKTMLGFLPQKSIYGDWSTLLLQLSLFVAALALVFSGPGLAAVDNAIFGKPPPADDHDGE